VRQGFVEPSFSVEILEEYAEVLAHPKFGFPPDEIEALIVLIRSQGEEIHDPQPLASACRIQGTTSFSGAPKLSGVDFIVTDNKLHLPPAPCFDPVCTGPRQLGFCVLSESKRPIQNLK
jgi:hypothetical protein